MLVDETMGSNISSFYSNNKYLTAGNQSINGSKKSKDSDSIDSLDKEEDSNDANEISLSIQTAIEAKEEDPFLKYRDENIIDPKQFYLGKDSFI